MEKHSIRFFKIQRNIIVLLLVLLAISLASNVYLYCNVIEPLKEQEGEPETGAGWRQNIQGGMGWIELSISKGFTPGPGTKFNVSIGVKLWEPYTGSATYNFSFKVYERAEQSDRYPDIPVAEKFVSFNKSKDVMYILLGSGNLTVTVPSTRGIYIYKVCFGTMTEIWHTNEFPIVVRYTLY